MYAAILGMVRWVRIFEGFFWSTFYALAGHFKNEVTSIGEYESRVASDMWLNLMHQYETIMHLCLATTKRLKGEFGAGMECGTHIAWHIRPVHCTTNYRARSYTILNPGHSRSFDGAVAPILRWLYIPSFTVTLSHSCLRLAMCVRKRVETLLLLQ